MNSQAAPESGLFKLLSPGIRTQSTTDNKAAALRGAAAGTTTIWLVQPFDWLRRTCFEKCD